MKIERGRKEKGRESSSSGARNEEVSWVFSPFLLIVWIPCISFLEFVPSFRILDPKNFRLEMQGHSPAGPGGWVPWLEGGRGGDRGPREGEMRGVNSVSYKRESPLVAYERARPTRAF